MRGTVIRADGGALAADICTYKPTGDPAGAKCSTISVTRLDATTVQMVVPRSRIDKGARVFRWRGGSLALDNTSGCTDGPFCQDGVPDKLGRYLTWRV